MKPKHLFLALCLLICAATMPIAGQSNQHTQRTPIAATAPTVVPALIPYSGTAVASDGKPLTGDSLATFQLFKDEQGGQPLWAESQIITIDAQGHYQVQLGASLPSGLPLDAFASGEARWLEIQLAGQPQQPRILLMSVPYAIKAADAATLGGLPASAFALAGATPANRAESSAGVTPDASSTVTTPGGTSGYLPVYTALSVIGKSTLFQSGSSVGIGTAAPSATLDVNGTVNVRGVFSLDSAAVATAASGHASLPFAFHASSYNSSTKAATTPIFEFKAEPTGNNSAAPGATLNLLYTNGGTPSETGLSIKSNGIVQFASGQTFGSNATTATAVTGTSTSGDGVLGDTAGTTLNTAGVLGMAGSSSGFGGIAGVWGDAFSHVGVLGTSYGYAGVQGVSHIGQGVQGQSDSGFGVEGTSTSGPGVSGTSNTSDGVMGSTGGTSLYTAGVLGSAGARTSFQGIAGVWGDAAAHVGVFGSSNQYAGVQGQSTQGQGVQGISTSNSGVQGTSTSGTGVAGTSTTANGMLGYTYGNTQSTAGVLGGAGGPSGYTDIAGVWGDSASHDGVYGSSLQATGVYGVSGSGSGLYGVSYNSSTFSDVAGVYGFAAGVHPGVRGINTGTGPAALFTNASANTPTMTVNNGGESNGTATAVLAIAGQEGGIGVEGETIGGIAVYGAVGLAPAGNRLSGYAGNVGVWGDSTSSSGVAVIGSASGGVAGYFSNNSDYNSTILAENYGSGGTGFAVGPFGAFQAATTKGSCGVGGNGDLTCTGQLKALSAAGNGARMVETYAMQSPENWMEDFGSGTLEHGVATVVIDPAFAETVSAGADYHVFLTPNGDSRGLYVASKTARGFEVRESGGGGSNISFDYRIVASRRGYEGQRMVDVTDAIKAAHDHEAAQFKKLTRVPVTETEPKR